MEKSFLNKIEVAVKLGLSIATINRRLASGEIPSIKIGSRVLIPFVLIHQLEMDVMNSTAIQQSTVKSAPVVASASEG
jgi:excisionase family DNA binding protein